MSRFWDSWATAYRNWRAALAVLLLLPILIWALAVKDEMSSQQLLAVDHATAIVRKIVELDTSKLSTKFGATGISVYQGYLELPDGNEIELTLIPPIPKIGDRVPLIVEHYDDGKTYYRIDRDEWQLFGPM